MANGEVRQPMPAQQVDPQIIQVQIISDTSRVLLAGHNRAQRDTVIRVGDDGSIQLLNLLTGQTPDGQSTTVQLNSAGQLFMSDSQGATTRKVLGQQAPAATTEVVLYTVPASTAAESTGFGVANRGASELTFRMGISVGGGVLANVDYVFYDVKVPAGDAFADSRAYTLAATDEVRVRASTADATFYLLGKEFA